MKIGINCSFIRKPSTGIGQVSLNFLNALIEKESQFKQSVDREYIIYLEEDIDIELPENFSKKVFLPFWKRDDLIRKIKWENSLLPKRVANDGVDVFISLYQCPTVLLSGNVVKHLMVVHDLIPKLFPEYLNNSRKQHYHKLTEKAMDQADKIIAISKRTEKDLIQHLNFDPADISVQYIDVDPIYKTEYSKEEVDEVLQRYNLKSGYIYYAGGLDIRKNVEGLLRAYKELLEDNEKTGFATVLPLLVISGKLMPEMAPLITDAENISKQLGIEKYVKLLDFVPQEDMPALYKGAKMFVYPSNYEGFGLPPLEAMNQGVPVITSKVSSIPEVGGDSVLYCDPKDPGDIKMVMKKLIKDENLQKVLSERGVQRAKRFSWNIFVDKIINIIHCGL